MEKSAATEKVIEAARAVNRLLNLSSSDNEALLKVLQDYFLLPEDDPVDDSEVDSDEEWRVADELEETITSVRQEDTASMDTNEDIATKSMHTNERTTASKELPSLVNSGAQVPEEACVWTLQGSWSRQTSMSSEVKLPV